MTEPRPLDGIRVIDASDHLSGQFCARMLADQGAAVTLVEPPGGSPIRRQGPFRGDAEPPEDSLLFWHLNVGKRSVTVDVATNTGRAVINKLCAGADVAIVRPEQAGQLSDAGTRITCSVSDFGADGPYAHWRGSELIHQALSGVMYTTGHPAKEPIYGVGHRAYYACGVTAYTTVLAALFERDRSGQGQRVEATVVEACAAMAQNLVTFATYSGTSLTRKAYPGMMGMFQCSDGWVVLFALQNWPGICTAFQLDGYADDERFLTYTARTANWPAAIALLSARARTLRVADVVRVGQANRITVSQVATVGEVRDSAHLAERGYWQQATDARGQSRTVLGPMFRPSGWPVPIARPAPTLGNATLTELAGVDVVPAETDALRRAGIC